MLAADLFFALDQEAYVDRQSPMLLQQPRGRIVLDVVASSRVWRRRR